MKTPCELFAENLIRPEEISLRVFNSRPAGSGEVKVSIHETDDTAFPGPEPRLLDWRSCLSVEATQAGSPTSAQVFEIKIVIRAQTAIPAELNPPEVLESLKKASRDFYSKKTGQLLNGTPFSKLPLDHMLKMS